MRGQCIAATGLARLRLAQLEDMPAGRSLAEVMIEGDDPVHFRARQIKRLRDQRHRRVRDIAKGFLQLVQDGQ
jgi:hypothetical protein